jgi:spore coat protein U-like protein
MEISMFSSKILSPRLLGATAIAGLALAAAPAYATTATSTLDVSATVTSSCAVTTSALDFGNVDVTSGSNADGTGSISVTCTNGTAWAAAADAGAGTGATVASRKMTSGANLLNYALYSDSSRTTVWGDGVGETIDGTGTGTAQSTTIYGRVPSGQTVPAGGYADTVNVTVTY